MVNRIYPSELQLNKANTSDTEVPFLDSTSLEVCHTNFAYTYFVKNQSEIEQINSTLKQFWEIENVQSPHDAPIVHTEEQNGYGKR